MNAIILAAGMGTRLRPLTNDIPKCLVKVCGVPMVERQIEFLHDRGITDITLISGYKADALNYLIEKFGVDIIFNDRFDICNNIYSMYLAKNRFENTYVIEGDVFMSENCFTPNITKSTYFAMWKDSFRNEWRLDTDINGKLEHVTIGDGSGLIMSGISFWNAEHSQIINNEIARLVATESYENFFWDNAVLNVLSRIEVNVKQITGLHEIDNAEELMATENNIRQNLAFHPKH